MAGRRGAGPASAETFRVTAGERIRFEQRVERGPGCWNWLGAINRGGYGTISLAYRKGPTMAHRAAWAIANGPIPAGINVLHRCDNPRCVRIDHLFLGTHRDNMADMHAKGRASLHIPTTRCAAGHLYTSGNTIDRGGRSDVLIRECVICRLKEEQERVRGEYYEALAIYRRHVDENIVPVLPDESVARSALTHREFEIVARTLGVYGREPECLAVLAYVHGVSRQRVEQIRDAAFKHLGIPLNLIDWNISRRFGLAAAAVNTIPSRRKRKPQHIDAILSTTAA